jgi:prepilin-type N-terminal cleavage/methylation domain-containing protein
MMRHSQRGFTLIELMAVTAAMGIVMLAGSAFMIRALAWHGEIAAKIEMNRHARTAYELWAYGGRSATNGKDGSKNVYGVRGQRDAPKKEEMRNTTGSLLYKYNNLTLTPDYFATMTVACKGADNPIPACKDTTSKTVTGWLGEDVDVKRKAGSLGRGWVTVEYTITNPYQAQRAKAPALFTDTYRTVFTLHRNEDDP